MNPLLKIRNPYLPTYYQTRYLLAKRISRSKIPHASCVDCGKELSVKITWNKRALRCHSCGQRHWHGSSHKRAQIAAIIAENTALTLECIGQRVGLTRERVRQIVKEDGLVRSRQSFAPKKDNALLQWPCPDCGNTISQTVRQFLSATHRRNITGRPDEYRALCRWCTNKRAMFKRKVLTPPAVCQDCGKERIYKGHSNRYKMRTNPPKRCQSCHIKWVHANYVPKTRCKRGHEFTPENTYVWKRARQCRTCSRIRSGYIFHSYLPKTHCIHGHERTEENVYHTKTGARGGCRECDRIRKRVK